ncbi:MAG: hypothetical protein AAF636_25025 [Pseudomonadota bacterium]
MAKRCKVLFLYRSSGGYLESTLMRGFQLCELAREHLGDRYDFAMRAVPNLQRLRIEAAWIAMQPKRAIFLYVKDVVDRFSPEGLRRMQARSAGTALDYVDRHLHIMPHQGIDLHISASLSGVDAMRARLRETAETPNVIKGDVACLLHGADLRIHKLPKVSHDGFRPVYFGSPHVTTIPQALQERLEVIDATTIEKMAENYRSVAGYNFHYAVRQIVEYPHIRGRKPLTKAVTAAVLGANVLTHADEDDALPLLGPDYPFMTCSTDHGEILEMMARAEREFGGPVWDKARSQMEALASRVSFKAQMDDLEAILKRLAG